MMTMIPKLFVHEEFSDDNESLGWVLSNGNHPRDVEVVPLNKDSKPYIDIPPWVTTTSSTE